MLPYCLGRAEETLNCSSSPNSGILFGVAIRTRKPIAVSLAPIIWKIILDCDVTEDDLDDVDVHYASTLRSMAAGSEEYNGGSAAPSPSLLLLPAEHFEGVSFSGRVGVPLFPGGRRLRLTAANARLFSAAAMRQRMAELRPAAAAVREGIAAIVPLPILRLMPPRAVEEMVCGMPEISMKVLKRVARYR